LFVTRVVEEGEQVTGEVVDPVSADVAGCGRSGVTALIRRDGVISGGFERGQRVPLGIGALGEAVGEDHRRAGSGFVDDELDAVDGGDPGGGRHGPAA
jgi:hypothetical protein